MGTGLGRVGSDAGGGGGRCFEAVTFRLEAASQDMMLLVGRGVSEGMVDCLWFTKYVPPAVSLSIRKEEGAI